MKFRLQTCRLQLLWLIATLATSALCAGDWPQYRGPNHDGQSTETIRTNWAQEAPRPIWKVPLAPGLSSFSVSGGRAFTLVRRPVSGQDEEFCVALNADAGNELWSSDPLGRAYYPDGGVGIDDGPRSTPSVDGDRVYVLTSYLRLYCLAATNGASIWSKDLVTAYGSDVVAWQSAASPLVEGDLVFVIANAPNQCLLAFHKSDGSEAWKGQSDVMTQSSPVAATIAGVRQVIFFAKSGLVSVAPDSGSVLWRYPFPFSTSTAASPVVGSDVVYCSAAYGSGAGAVQITNSGSQLATNQVWRTPGANMNHWATPVLNNGYLFGIYGQQGPGVSLRCIDFTTGSEKWRQSGVGSGGGVLFVAGHVLVLAEDGNLLLVKPDPTEYTEVARYRALDGSSNSIPDLAVKCWNVPAISNGRIYARSTTEAVCLDVADAAPPTNHPPNAPTNVSPPDGATNQLLTLTLQASPFDDPDGDGHESSHWILRRSLDDTIVFDSGNDTNNKTSIAAPTGALSNSTTYSWSVFYTDSHGAQGPASTPTSFTTQQLAPLKLFATSNGGEGLFQLLIGNEDGSPLDTNRAPGIDVFASTDLTLGLSGWIKLTNPITLTNGQLYLDEPQSPAMMQRFFRVEARP